MGERSICDALVIEQDIDTREVMLDLLGGEGLSVTGAARAAAGLALLKSGLTPAAIILDLSGLDAEEVEKAYDLFRAGVLAPSPPIIVTITAETIPVLPVLAVVRKPFDPDALFRILWPVVRGRQWSSGNPGDGAPPDELH